MKYDRDPRFDSYYLEDSYVLGLSEDGPKLTFALLLVLTPKHPMYAPPPPSEQYCYRKGTLCFEGVSGVNWIERHFRPTHDPDGEIDYGNIDNFEIGPDGEYSLQGGWGWVKLTAERAAIALS